MSTRSKSRTLRRMSSLSQGLRGSRRSEKLRQSPLTHSSRVSGNLKPMARASSYSVPSSGTGV